MAITIQTNNRTTSGFGVTVAGAAAGQNAFEIELNRDPSFELDDTIGLTTGAAAQIAGLPSGTPWALRGRPVGDRAWGPVHLTTTTAVSAIPPYSGFAIDQAMVVVPEPIANIGATAAGAAPQAAFPPRNLLRDDPISTFRAAGPGVFHLDFETSGAPIDTIALLGTLANDDATWAVTAYTGRGGAVVYTSPTTPLRCSTGIDRRAWYHGLMRLPARLDARAWRITITHTAPLFVARNLIVGLARQSVNASQDSGQALNDFGSLSRGRFGTPDRVRGWRGTLVDFEISWLREAEYEAKWSDLRHRVGSTDPILAIVNSKRNAYLNDRIAFGALTTMRASNVRSSRHTVPMEINSIY